MGYCVLHSYRELQEPGFQFRSLALKLKKNKTMVEDYGSSKRTGFLVFRLFPDRMVFLAASPPIALFARLLRVGLYSRIGLLLSPGQSEKKRVIFHRM